MVGFEVPDVLVELRAGTSNPALANAGTINVRASFAEPIVLA
jgi:hypothetical protein